MAVSTTIYIIKKRYPTEKRETFFFVCVHRTGELLYENISITIYSPAENLLFYYTAIFSILEGFILDFRGLLKKSDVIKHRFL